MGIIHRAVIRQKRMTMPKTIDILENMTVTVVIINIELKSILAILVPAKS